MKMANLKKAVVFVFFLLSLSFCFISSVVLVFAALQGLNYDYTTYDRGHDPKYTSNSYSGNWLEGWNYRQSHTVVGSQAGAQTDYPMKVIVERSGGISNGDTIYVDTKCNANFSDIRFTDSSETDLLDYWLESIDGTTATFWVEVPTIPASPSDTTIYVYYDNSGAPYVGDGEATFSFFDDFEDNSINTTKWEIISGTPTESGGQMHAEYQAGTRGIIESVDSFGINIAVRSKFALTGPWTHGGEILDTSISTCIAFYRSDDLWIMDANNHGSQQRHLWNGADSDFHIWETRWTFGRAEIINTDGSEGSRVLTTTVPTDADHLMTRFWSGISTNCDADAEWILIRNYVYPEPSHGDWGDEEGNHAPEIVSFSITDMDDVDNLYAQKQYYTAQYVVTDDDGYADIDYAEFSINQSSNIRATFRFDEDTAAFSIEEGGSTWALDSGNCSYVSSGTTITMNFMISPKFNAVEESDIDISAFVIDDEPENNTETIQTDYADVVTNLVVSGFACDDDRGDVGQSLNFSGTIYYANDPSSTTASSSYPPDNEFTAVHVYDSGGVSRGSDNTTVDGTFSVSFSALSSVTLETYNPYIDMADVEYTDAAESPTDTFISDRIKILSLGANDTRLNIGDYTEIYASAELEYDHQSLGSGDSLTIESLDLVWNGTYFVGTESKDSVQQKVYDEGEGEEDTYEVTAFNMSSKSVSVIWDRLNVTFSVDDSFVPLDIDAEFNVAITREYDSSLVSSYSYNISCDGSEFNNPHTTETFTDISSLEVARIYDFTYVVDKTYDLTTFIDPVDLFVEWYEDVEAFVFARFSYNCSNPDVSESILFNGDLSNSSSPITDYEWDFGDETSDSGETVIHSYAANGIYLVTLNVTSEVGFDVYSTYISVGQSDPVGQPDQFTPIGFEALIVITAVAIAGVAALIYFTKIRK